MNVDLTHQSEMERLSRLIDTDPELCELLRKARLALQRAPLKQHSRPTHSAYVDANVIQFPADRIVRIHRNTGPAAEAPPGENHA